MATIRRGRRPADNFTIISNDAARDSRLSLRARGLLVLLSSHAVGYTTSLRALARQNPEGIDAIRVAVNELERFGYLVRERVRDEKGTLREADWVLTEPTSDYPTLGEPTSGNPTAKEQQRQEQQRREHQDDSARARATGKQREWLSDLHVQGGGTLDAGFTAYLDSLSPGEASAAIKEAERVIRRRTLP
jgi:hypothetical protein